jgi:hypothetical protein
MRKVVMSATLADVEGKEVFMSYISPVVENAEHAGVRRVLTAASLVEQKLSHVSAPRFFRWITVASVMASVTFAARALDAVALSFSMELLALTAVAVVAFAFMVAVVVPSLRLIARVLSQMNASMAKSHAENSAYENAMRDPRMRAEIQAAQSRQREMAQAAAERDHPTPAWHALPRYW